MSEFVDMRASAAGLCASRQLLDIPKNQLDRATARVAAAGRAS